MKYIILFIALLLSSCASEKEETKSNVPQVSYEQVCTSYKEISKVEACTQDRLCVVVLKDGTRGRVDIYNISNPVCTSWDVVPVTQ